LASYGAGCTGPGGALTLGASNLPWTRNKTQNPGSTVFETVTSGMGPFSIGVGIVGLSQIAPGAFPLVNLTGTVPGPGAGCDLLASLDILTAVVPTAGVATMPLDLGDLALDPTLQDLPFYVQMADLDFSAGWIGTYTSNGLACKIGVL
jgi:hypothetical protein